MSSKKCNCPNSKLFPHRADKCAFSTKKKSSTSSVPPPVPSSSSVSLDLSPPSQDNSTDIDVSLADQTASLTLLSPEEEEVIVQANTDLPNGEEQCDCVMYRVSHHRKKYCRWKKHVKTAMMVSAGVVAGAAAVMLVAGAAGKEKNEEEKKEDLILAVGMGMIAVSATNELHQDDVRRRRQHEQTQRHRAIQNTERDLWAHEQERQQRLLQQSPTNVQQAIPVIPRMTTQQQQQQQGPRAVAVPINDEYAPVLLLRKGSPDPCLVESTPPNGTCSSTGSTNTAVSEEMAAKEANDIIIDNEKLPNGEEQCDCMMYKVQQHRKKKCCWKRHALTEVGVCVGVVAVAGAAVLATNAFYEASNNEAQEAQAAQEEAQAKQAAEESIEAQRIRDLEVAERRRLAEEAEATRRENNRLRQELLLQQQQQQQELENERLQAVKERLLQQQQQQKSNTFTFPQSQPIFTSSSPSSPPPPTSIFTFNSSPQLNPFIFPTSPPPPTQQPNTFTYSQPSTTTINNNTVSYSSSQSTSFHTTPVRSRQQPALYGTTKAGTTCKNCIDKGGRCHQHPL